MKLLKKRRKTVWPMAAAKMMSRYLTCLLTKPKSISTATNVRTERKRSLTIAGHSTSLSLEPEFWEALKAAAMAQGKSMAALVAEIDQAREGRNLSSAIRVWILQKK